MSSKESVYGEELQEDQNAMKFPFLGWFEQNEVSLVIFLSILFFLALLFVGLLEFNRRRRNSQRSKPPKKRISFEDFVSYNKIYIAEKPPNYDDIVLLGYETA